MVVIAYWGFCYKKLIDEINNLELSEKLLLVEDILDSIAASNSELPMPEWNAAKQRKGREGFWYQSCKVK